MPRSTAPAPDTSRRPVGRPPGTTSARPKAARISSTVDPRTKAGWDASGHSLDTVMRAGLRALGAIEGDA